MAERSCETPQSVVPQNRPSSTGQAVRSKRIPLGPRSMSATCPTKIHTDDLLAKEEEYKLLNAELEAKTADLVKQAEELIREQGEVLSRPLSNVLLSDDEGVEDYRIIKSPQCPHLDLGTKMAIKKKDKLATSNLDNIKQGKDNKSTALTIKKSQTDNSADVENEDLFLAKTIQKLEEKISTSPQQIVVDDIPLEDIVVGSGISDAQIRVFKAKLRIMQEELDHLSSEYYKKDDETAQLTTKIKELEEDRTRLQRSTNLQQTQIDKYKSLAEESSKKSDGLQIQVSALNKEIESLKRSQKQATVAHSTVEIRLNRALEEAEKLKAQLNKTKQINKDKISEEHESKETLLAENKLLKKQKAELITGFKKQLKLIDILKKQKMHFEAAKLLSFSEEEFIKALDWGKS